MTTLHLENHNTLISYQDATLDQISCNYLLSQLADSFPTLQACYRVLRPGGILKIQDDLNCHYPRAADYIDTIYQMLNPTHNHLLTDDELRGVLLDSGFEIITFQKKKKIQIAQNTPYQEKIRLLLCLAPQPVQQFLSPIDGDKLTFHSYEVHITAKKPV
ncbi:MAG: methyltransferase domain-containing protein [Chloroflexi bacterium]|nr:MAG: methyltransferase domain-containing protein [Chloroflexota bacterium]